MDKIRYPLFLNKRILKKEMLEDLRDYPRDVMDIYTQNMSDGIVWGLSPKVDKNTIKFCKGVTKYKGNVYVLNKNICVDYKETEEEVMLKLKFYDNEEESDYQVQNVEICIDENTKILENEQELGRFKLSKGAYLRSEYQGLYDFTTEYNTINIVNVLYAGYKQSTISISVVKYFATEVLKLRPQNQMDISFCMIALNSERIEREVVSSYIAYRLEEENNILSNIEIHKKLVIILEKIKKESTGIRRAKREVSKIIVD